MTNVLRDSDTYILSGKTYHSGFALMKQFDFVYTYFTVSLDNDYM